MNLTPGDKMATWGDSIYKELQLCTFRYHPQRAILDDLILHFLLFADRLEVHSKEGVCDKGENYRLRSEMLTPQRTESRVYSYRRLICIKANLLRTLILHDSKPFLYVTRYYSSLKIQKTTTNYSFITSFFLSLFLFLRSFLYDVFLIFVNF